MSDDQPKIIILHETAIQSWLRDIGSAAAAIALIGTGVWAGSSAMQWVGAILFFLLLIARSVRLGNTQRLNLREAENVIRELRRRHEP